jgi:tRNA dimethylallyltransferase
VANWLKYAEEKIIEIRNKNKTPIICGGTGLYIDALLYGITDNPSPNLEIRKELEKINIDTQISKQEKIIILQNIIKNLNLEYFISLNNSEKNNTERLIRKIEILKQNNNTININHEKVLRYDVNFILIDPDIDTLKNNIKIRLEKRLYPVGDFAKSENYNLIDEVKNLIENKKVDPEWLQSLGLQIHNHVCEK